MSFKSPIPQKANPTSVDKIGKVVFVSMVTCIVTYHGLDSARKLYTMTKTAGDGISAYFRKKKEEAEAEKAAQIK